ncbi:hypothetical protein ACHQM5_016382 [Ranunculus cassubicifolius]
MSEQPQLQQQQPPVVVTQQADSNSTHTNHGSVGALIAVLAVITVLGAIAVMIGRLCSGRKVMGYGDYDFDGWVEKKCSSCIDGNINAPPSLPLDMDVSHDSVPVAIPMEIPEEEINQTETVVHPPTTSTQ